MLLIYYVINYSRDKLCWYNLLLIYVNEIISGRFHMRNSGQTGIRREIQSMCAIYCASLQGMSTVVEPVGTCFVLNISIYRQLISLQSCGGNVCDCLASADWVFVLIWADEAWDDGIILGKGTLLNRANFWGIIYAQFLLIILSINYLTFCVLCALSFIRSPWDLNISCKLWKHIFYYLLCWLFG